jgi:hypothetical protein
MMIRFVQSKLSGPADAHKRSRFAVFEAMPETHLRKNWTRD